MSTRHLAIGFQRGLDDPAARLHAYHALVGQAALANEVHEAARAIAALLDLAAVGIEDAVAKIDAGLCRLLDDQNLVAADAEVTIGDAPDLAGVEHDGLGDRVENNEIVTQSLHLGEANACVHGAVGPNPRSRRVAGTRPFFAKGNAVPSVRVTDPFTV